MRKGTRTGPNGYSLLVVGVPQSGEHCANCIHLPRLSRGPAAQVFGEASHAAGTHGWLPQKTGRPGLRRGGVGGYNLHSVPPNSPPDCGTVAHQPREGCIRLVLFPLIVTTYYYSILYCLLSFKVVYLGLVLYTPAIALSQGKFSWLRFTVLVSLMLCYVML